MRTWWAWGWRDGGGSRGRPGIAYIIITVDGKPLADEGGIGIIVFETEASAARFLLPGERIEPVIDDVELAGDWTLFN